jgi:predicted nuclease of predicted toxin-antitoxin system
VGTLSSELSPHAASIAGHPRVYVDANMPARLVSLMRTLLKWDVLFVMEHDELRRAADTLHFRLAGQFRRTLVTLDRDYLDDRKFPPAESPGVLVLTAPNENGLAALLKRLDRDVFRAAPDTPAQPFEGHKIQVHVDWRAPHADARPEGPQSDPALARRSKDARRGNADPR